MAVAMVALAACGPGPGHTDASRLVLEALAREQDRPIPPPVDLPLDVRCRSVYGKTTVLQEGLQFTGLQASSGFAIRIELDAENYNRLHIEMRTNKGAQCRFSWSSEHEPVLPGSWHILPAPSVETQIFPNEQFHSYTLKLGPEHGWVGKVDQIFFAPSDVPAESLIRSVRLYYEAPDYPSQLAFDGTSHEILYGTQPPWKVLVPENGVFETRLGMLERSWQYEFKGVVRFLVTLDCDETRDLVLLDKKLTPGIVEEHRKWFAIRRDLSDYAGKEVTLNLTVNSLDVPLGDYAYWGNPIVYSESRSPGDIPVILISCDTLRADHLSCYGYELETSPVLDAWAEEDAVLFENAIVPATWTLPSHITMMTGLEPKNHRTTVTSNLPPEIQTLPELLREAGYLTGGFTGMSFWFLPVRGYHGFDQYDIPPGTQGFRHIYATADRVQTWLEAHDTSRFFLFFHNYDMHSKYHWHGFEFPYGPGDIEFRLFSKELYEHDMFHPSLFRGLKTTDLLFGYNDRLVDFTERQHATLRLLYDDAIRMVDRNIHEFFSLLKQQGRYDNALIIVTADHGEELNDHGNYGHYSVYEEVCRVPLLIKFPDEAFAGTRFAPQVESTDLYTTILDVLGLPEPTGRDGASLLKVLKGEIPTRDYTHITREDEYAIRTNETKLIYRRGPVETPYRLYDLTKDPKELQNLYPGDEKQTALIKEDLHAFYPSPTEGWHLDMEGSSWRPLRVLVDADGPFMMYWSSDRSEFDTFVHKEGDPPLVIDTSIRKLYDVVIKTASTKSRVRVEMVGDTPFEVFRGEEEPKLSLNYATVLDPAKDKLAKPVLPTDRPHPVIAIWFEEPALEQDAAPAPDAETKQILEGIGYL